MECTKHFCKFLEDISKEVRFYNVDALTFTKNSIPSEENFNGHAKILITHVLYGRANPEVY